MKPGPKEAALKALRSKNAAVFQQPAAGNAGLRAVPAMRAVDGALGNAAGNDDADAANSRTDDAAGPAMQGVPIENEPAGMATPRFDRVAYQREYMRLYRARKKGKIDAP